jgi:hypothetical protein
MRPEYVKCVSLPESLGATTWCGKSREPFDWSFVDIDHAALTRRNGGRQLVCPECRAAIVAALESEA